MIEKFKNLLPHLALWRCHASGQVYFAYWSSKVFLKDYFIRLMLNVLKLSLIIASLLMNVLFPTWIQLTALSLLMSLYSWHLRRYKWLVWVDGRILWLRSQCVTHWALVHFSIKAPHSCLTIASLRLVSCFFILIDIIINLIINEIALITIR